ncbi:MAG: alpha/beta fold hydrolase [Achromobacter sp.]|jgi:dipeptidyl aminopeptidase/acylaminoacyl peptidase
MTTTSQAIEINVQNEEIAGTFLAPGTRLPGVLFVHGWGSGQKGDLARARGVAALGCVCLTFDLRGHAATQAQHGRVSREDNYRDVVAAYDMLAAHPSVDPEAIAIVGSSYGGYLAALLTTHRPVKWLALQVPALYRDEHWTMPKGQLNRADLTAYRQTHVQPQDNRALRACAAFKGDVLIVESEHDTYVPHPAIMSYRAAFQQAHSLTHRIIDGADHALSTEASQEAYTWILLNWATEMVSGARLGGLGYGPPVMAV